MSDYKEDSTKGASVLSPKSFKYDMISHVWFDSRTIATIVLWMEEEGVFPKSLSDAVRMPLEMLVEKLVDNGTAQMVESTIDAREILSRRFRINLNHGNKGRKNLLHNTILSSELPKSRNKLSVEELQRSIDSIVSETPGEALESLKAHQEKVAAAIEQFRKSNKVAKE